MAEVYLEPFITDARDCVYLASHPETFFKAMDDLKPYVLTVVANDYAHFRLIRDDVVDLVDMRKKLKHLNNLGYRTDITFTVRTFMGNVWLEMSDLKISWPDSRHSSRCSC